MSMALAFAALAVGVLLFPLRHVRPAARPSRGADRTGRVEQRASPATRTAVATTLAGAAFVAAFGLPGGAVAALVGCPVVAFALRAVQRRPTVPGPDRSAALCLDLVAAALHSGLPLADAIVAAAPAAAPATQAALLRVAGLLRLGADPAQAWSVIGAESPLRPVAVTAMRSAASGIRLAQAFERLAADTRAELGAAATVRAHRAGVFAMAPLGMCFLPSFVCLGVVPVLVGIAGTVTGVMP